MTIGSKKEGGTLLVTPEGRLDTTTSPELDAVIENSLEGVDTLILDMEEVEYISSAGLRVLYHAKKALGGQGTLKLTHVNEILQEIFDVTGFLRILTIE